VLPGVNGVSTGVNGGMIGAGGTPSEVSR